MYATASVLFSSIILECPHLLVRNDTEDNQVYLYPPMVETELTDTSEGILLVNCSSSGWPTPIITWSVDVQGNRSSIYNFPNYNVTENGQVSLWSCCNASYAAEPLCVPVFIYT